MNTNVYLEALERMGNPMPSIQGESCSVVNSIISDLVWALTERQKGNVTRTEDAAIDAARRYFASPQASPDGGAEAQQAAPQAEAPSFYNEIFRSIQVATKIEAGSAIGVSVLAFKEELARRGCMVVATPAQAEAKPAGQGEARDYEEVLADHRRLVRELDLILNGEEGAAKQASLCDIVSQSRRVIPDWREALRFYADGAHFTWVDEGEWDTISAPLSLAVLRARGVKHEV